MGPGWQENIIITAVMHAPLLLIAPNSTERSGGGACLPLSTQRLLQPLNGGEIIEP